MFCYWECFLGGKNRVYGEIFIFFFWGKNNDDYNKNR